MPIEPTEIPAIPTPVPSSSDPVNFDARADAVLGALPGVVDGMNQAAADTFQNATEASASAALSVAASSAASAAVGAAGWNPATNYATNASAISPITYQTYRRVAPGGVDATDPSASALWVPVGLALNEYVSTVDRVMTSAARMPAGSNAQRPSSPALGFTRINSESAAGLRFMEFWDGVQWVPVGRTNPVALPAVGSGGDFNIDPVPTNVKRIEIAIYDFAIAATTDQALNLYVSDNGSTGSGHMTRNRIRGVSSGFLATSNVAAEQDSATAGVGSVISLIPTGLGGAGVLNGKITLTRTADPSEWLYEFSLAKTGTLRHLIGAGRFEIIGTAVLGRIRLLYTYDVAPGRAEVTYEF